MYALNFDLGYLVGVMAGDGSIIGKTTLSLANVDPGVILKFNTICAELTGKPSKTYANQHTFKGYSCYSESHRVSDKILASYISEKIGRGAFNKRVPVETNNIDFSKGIISGLWDSDGTITFNNNRKTTQAQVSITSRSIMLVNSTDIILKSLGCNTSIYKYSRFGSPLYILNILGYSIPNFCKMVTLYHTVRKCRLRDAETIASNSRNLTKVPIEECERNRLLSLLKEKYKEDNISKKNYHNIFSTLSKARIENTITHDSYYKIKTILETN